MKVDVIQVFISTAAIFGIGLIWFNFNEKVLYTVIGLVKAPFHDTNEAEDNSE